MVIINSAIVRLAVLVFALSNQILVTMGYEALPWSGDEIGQAITGILTAISAFWVYWKNNSHTPAAITADKLLQIIKDGTTTAQKAQEIIQAMQSGTASAYIDELKARQKAGD